MAKKKSKEPAARGGDPAEVTGAPAEVTDEPLEVVSRAAAIDVAKDSGMVCTRVPHESKAGRRLQRVWQVTARYADVVALMDEMVCQGIQRLVLESTSDYWRIWYYLAEAAGLQVWLVNARDARHLPGRPKTDLLTELRAGLVEVSRQAGICVASVSRHDHWRRSTAGVVPSGSAAVRFA